MKKLLLLSALTLVSLGFAVPSHAQIITWGAAQNMVGDTDVSANGSAFDAVTFFGSNLTVNGVTFTSISQSGGSHSDGIITITNSDNTGAFGGAFTTTSPSSANYSNLINAGTFGEVPTGHDSVTIATLTSGHTYQVESWSYYSGDGAATTTYTGSTPVTLTNGTGQYAIGTFTATGASESYYYFTGGGHNFLNAVSVRDLTSAPEPSTYLLLGLGLLGLVVVTQRRQRARA